MQDDGADVDAGDDEILDVPELVEETVDALPDRPEAWTRGSAHADVLHTLAPPPLPPADTWSVEDEVASTDVWSSDNPASDAADLDAPAEAWGADTQPNTNGWGADDDAPVAADSNWATSDTEETVAAWGSDDEVPSLPADNGAADAPSPWGADDDQATTSGWDGDSHGVTRGRNHDLVGFVEFDRPLGHRAPDGYRHHRRGRGISRFNRIVLQ